MILINMSDLTCQICGKQFKKAGPRQIHINSCSPERLNKQKQNIEDISLQIDENKYSCLVCNKVYTKMGIFTHWWLNHGSGQSHLEKVLDTVDKLHKSKIGKHSWNHGLTSKTDERVEKARNNTKKKYETGELVSSQKGKHLSKEAKEKISESQSLRLNMLGGGGFRRVGWYPHKQTNGKSCVLRGTWEVKVAEWLDKHKIKWRRDFPLKYFKNDLKRTYAPDFFLEDFSIILEIKGYYSDSDKEKMKLVEEQNREYNFFILFKEEIDNLNRSLSFLL